tara:strand:+ start:2877 stop:3848 length:972 start_codon:yes stop_codon:yes gene_type:complete
MNILLTGGAGYIGSHVAISLLDAGYKVTIIDDLSTGHQELIPKEANFIEANINNKKILKSTLIKNKFDVLMHFAGYIEVEESVKNPKKYFINNTDNAKVLFDICTKHNLQNIIFSSTAAAYGNPEQKDLIKENSILKPLNPYGKSKVETEKYLQNNSNFNYIILRYFNVAGADPLMRCGLISKNPTHLIKITSEAATRKRDKVVIFGDDYPTPDGTAIRDYIHVSDLADLHVRAAQYLTTKKESNIFNCGYGKGFSVKEVIETANEINEFPIKFEFGKRRDGDVARLVSDPSKIKKLLNWKPKYNNLKFILKTSIEWEKNCNI